jgi:hypothetical protein
MYEGPGIYRHYKGGHYLVLGVSQHESEGTKFVIYRSYDAHHELDRLEQGVDFVARPLDKMDGFHAFNFPVGWGEDRQQERFVKVS